MIHLAAQTGVRHSVGNPFAQLDVDPAGFTNVLEACRRNRVERLVHASSSPACGANARMPFSVHRPADPRGGVRNLIDGCRDFCGV